MPKKRPRLAPCCYIGQQRYFLTFCTSDRHHAFVDAERVQLVQEQILRAAATRAFAVIAYVWMPDHGHLLVEGQQDDADLCAFAHLAKQCSGHAYASVSTRRLWQPSFWDHVLREDEATWSVVRYICENPLRAGLVSRWEEYPFFGSGIMSRDELIRELVHHPPPVWKHSKQP